MKTAEAVRLGMAPPTEARRALHRLVLWPSWVLVVALVVPFALGLTVPAWVQYLPFALSLVLFGLPHGAVDHLAVPRLLGRRDWWGPALLVALVYLSLGALYLALWFAAPAAAFALFIALTWFHWGAGDLYALLTFAPAPAPNESGPASRVSRVLTLLARGGLPMLVPLLTFPDDYRAIAGSVTGLFTTASPDAFAWAFGPSFWVAAGGLFAALVVASLVLGHRAGGFSWRVDAGEMALLALYFTFVPPVLAVGLYLCLWHAPRHVARLVLLDEGGVGALTTGRPGIALVRFARDAAPLTVVALFLLLGLYLAVPGAGISPSALLAVYLVLISVLTLPHVAVVFWMDLRQGLWRRVIGAR